MNSKHERLATIRIDPPNPTGILVHALHKSGSMFLYQLLFRLCRTRRLRFFSGNHPEPDDSLVHSQMEQDFCLAPIRSFESPIAFADNVNQRRIFHVRDPRDLLVSQYYSYGWRHSDTGFDADQTKQRTNIRNLSIDQYVLDEHLSLRPLKARLAPLLRMLNEQTTRWQSQQLAIVKYEQMVSDFPSYMRQILPAFSFRFPAAVALRFGFRYRNEFQPDRERSGHKRAVIPGDHARKLQEQTMKQLDNIFHDELTALKYAFRKDERIGPRAA